MRRSNRPRLRGAALCAALLLPALAGAEVELLGARWQSVERPQDPVARAVDIGEVALVAGQPLKGRLLGKVKLLNRGPATKGILLRYVVAAKIAPLAQPQVSAVWALPYMIEEKRVPLVGANKTHEATLDPTALTAIYLKKIYRMGYWPQELKLQIMLEPRSGSLGPIQIIEAALPFRK